MPRKKQVQQREPEGKGGRGGGGGRRRKSYQPSLMQLVTKEREVRGEMEIDSDRTTGQFTIHVDFFYKWRCIGRKKYMYIASIDFLQTMTLIQM